MADPIEPHRSWRTIARNGNIITQAMNTDTGVLVRDFDAGGDRPAAIVFVLDECAAWRRVRDRTGAAIVQLGVIARGNAYRLGDDRATQWVFVDDPLPDLPEPTP